MSEFLHNPGQTYLTAVKELRRGRLDDRGVGRIVDERQGVRVALDVAHPLGPGDGSEPRAIPPAPPPGTEPAFAPSEQPRYDIGRQVGDAIDKDHAAEQVRRAADAVARRECVEGADNAVSEKRGRTRFRRVLATTISSGIEAAP